MIRWRRRVGNSKSQNNARRGTNTVLTSIDVQSGTGKVGLQEAVCFDEETNLAFLPVVLGPRSPYTNEVLASDAFRQLIDNLRKTFDYIIIDFPPVAPVVDVRAALQVVDSFVYVVEWGKTKMSLVERQMAAAPELHERLLGVILNKTNVKLLERYEGLRGGYYHKKYYGRYGYVS